MTIVGQTENEACPNLLFHQASGRKEIIAVDYAIEQDESVHKLGDWPLATLLQAYELIHASDAEYDIVTNNCASFVMNMMCQLSIPVTPEVLNFTVGRLVATSTEDIHESLAKSAHLTDLPMVSSSRSLEENKEDAVADLVYYYAATHEGLCFASNEKAFSDSAPTETAPSETSPAETWPIVAVAALLSMLLAMSCFVFGRRVGMKAATETPKGELVEAATPKGDGLVFA